MKAHRNTIETLPTPGPWSIEGDCLISCHWQYAGWPHFGRITIARLDGTWPQKGERQANLELISTAVNACFAVAPDNPLAVARAFSALVSAVEDVLAHGDDPNMPLAELRTRLQRALRQAKGGTV